MAEFSWAAAADVGLGAIGGISKFVSASAQDRVAAAQAKAQNTVRTAQNNQRASEMSLAATIRTINNRRVMEQGADALEAATTNALRTQDSFTKGNFEQSVKDAEAYGAASARAAAAGIGGASIRAISEQTRMTTDRMREYATERQGDITYDQLQALSGIIPDAVARQDFSPITGRFDRNVNTSNPKASLFGSLVDGLLSKKDSLHTLLGSFGGSDATNATPAAGGGATAYPVSQSTVTGAALPSFEFGAQSFPVSQSTVNGVALAPISIN